MLDIYDYKSYFNYTNGRYIIKDDKSEVPGCKFHVELEFSEKKIKEIAINYELDYSLEGEKRVTKIEGKLDFTYGNSTLITDDFPKDIDWKTRKDGMMFTLNDDNKYSYDKAIIDSETGVKIVVGPSISNKKKLSFKNTAGNLYLFYDDEDGEYGVTIYKNNVLLSKAKDPSSEGDYYFYEVDSTKENHYKYLIFKDDLKENDEIQMCIYHSYNEDKECACSLIEL